MAFIYYNVNPTGQTINDCVCRAISLATKSDYAFIYYLLYDNANSNDCDMLVKGCYRNVIEDFFGLTPHYGKGLTVNEIAKKHKNNRVILRIDGHLTCCINGDCWDIWDCGPEIVDEYWVVE